MAASTYPNSIMLVNGLSIPRTDKTLERYYTLRRVVRAISILLILVLATSLPLAQAQTTISEQSQFQCPLTVFGEYEAQQVHLQSTGDPTTMNVIWSSVTATGGGAYVQWFDSDGSIIGEDEAREYCYLGHNMVFYMATMSDLIPGQEVTYKIPSSEQFLEFSFTPIDSNAQHFEWISIADHGDSAEGEAVSDAIIADTSAQLVTISGDISYADGDQSVWDDWFNYQQESMVKIPWITCVGNHENEPGFEFTPYEHRFDSDGEEGSETFWYSRNYPGVHMVFMSTEHDYDVGSPQYTWLEQDLSSVDRTVTPFVIVYGHHPMYSSNSYHGSEVELRDAIENLYVEKGVDFVIAGHDHFYERTWPVNSETVVDTGTDGLFVRGQAPIHLVIGMAGRAAYEDLDEPQPEWSAYRENNSYGWTKWNYDGELREISFTFYRIDGTIGDQFTLLESLPVVEESDDEPASVPGFSSLITILAILGASLQSVIKNRDSIECESN